MWIDEEVGKIARTIRERRGLSIEALACIVGTSPAEVSDIEAGKLRLGAQRLFDYCRALEVPVSLFFEWQRDVPPSADPDFLEPDVLVHHTN